MTDWPTLKPKHCPGCEERRRDLAEARATIERVEREREAAETRACELQLQKPCPTCARLAPVVAAVREWMKPQEPYDDRAFQVLRDAARTVWPVAERE